MSRAGTTTPFHFGAALYSDLANFKGTDASCIHQLEQRAQGLPLTRSTLGIAGDRQETWYGGSDQGQ